MRTSSRWVALAVAAALGSSVARGDESPPATSTETAAPAPATTPPTPAPVAAPTPAPTVAAAAPAPAPAQASTDDVPRPSKGLTFGLGGGAAACLLTGIIVGALAKARSNEQDGDAGNPPLYTPALRDRGKVGDQMATGAYVMFAIGGALAIADIVLFVERYRSHLRKAPAPQAKAASVKPGPLGMMVTF